MKWESRITGQADMAPADLLANPHNWRIHPQHQQDALERVLDMVGWVQRVVVNETTGHVVDGHLRVALALRRDEATIPVNLVQLSEDEEKLALATFDLITGMAGTDSDKLATLLDNIEADEDVADLLASLHQLDQAAAEPEPEIAPEPAIDDGTYGVLVTFDNERAQSTGYDELVAMGYSVKVVNT